MKNNIMNYKPYSVQLNPNQKKSLAKAYNNKEAISIRLKNKQLKGNDEMLLIQTQINKINKSIKNKKGFDLKISKNQISKVVRRGGNLFTSLMALGSSMIPKLLPTASKIGSKVLPGLATGALSSLGSFVTDKLLGYGIQNRPQSFSGTNIYQIPYNNLPYLNNYLNLLTKPQLRNYQNVIKKGEGMNIKLNKTQNSVFLGTLLASIGIPILLKALTGSGANKKRTTTKTVTKKGTTTTKTVTKKGTTKKKVETLLASIAPLLLKALTESGANKKASGLQNRPPNYYQNPTPFIGDWDQFGKGVTKKIK